MFNGKVRLSSIILSVFAVLITSTVFSTILLCEVEAASTDGVSSQKIQTSEIDSNKSTLIGDVDANGQVDSVDFARMRTHLLGMISSFPASNGDWAADVSCDGVFNSIDFAYMRQYLLGDIKKFPAESNIVTSTPTVNVTSTPIPTTTPITKANSIEELKAALIQNFNNKGTTYTLTYSGSITNLESKVYQAIVDAVKESSEPFMLLDGIGWEANGYAGNLQLTFTFPYDNDNEYMYIVQSTDELKEVLLDVFYNRIQNINIIYKGTITKNDIINIKDSISNDDTYLNICINKFECSILTNNDVKISAIKFKCNYNTTKEQEDYVDSKVESIVSSLINADMTDDEKEKLIHDYIVNNVEYSLDEKYGSAYSALYYGKTKCDGYAMLTYKMLKAAGIENIIVTNEDHAWNVVKINDKWYHLDTTWDDPENDISFYRFYNLSDDEINKLDENRNYISVNGIKCVTNYISDLSERNTQSGGKYDGILKDIQENR